MVWENGAISDVGGASAGRLVGADRGYRRFGTCGINDGRVPAAAGSGKWRSRRANVRMTSSVKTEEGRSCSIFPAENQGVVRISGADRGRFLHNMSTNNINALKPGEVRMTTLTTKTGRTIEILTVFAEEDKFFILLSGNMVSKIVQLFDMYIFPRDKVEIEDVSEQFAVFFLDDDLSKMSEALEGGAPKAGTFVHTELSGTPVLIGSGNDLGIQGYTVVTAQEHKGAVMDHLSSIGFDTTISSDEWERKRVKQGRPKAGNELTDDYNPLEAGLWKTVSFKKGCYIGQETIARLNTYDGVRQNLFGISLSSAVEQGEVVYKKDTTDKAGVITSCVDLPDGSAFGLAFVKRKVGGEGLEVKVGDAEGTVVEIPFASRGIDQSADEGFV